MKKFSKKPNTSLLQNLSNLTTDQLLYKLIPQFLMEIMHKYFRLELEGVENLPKKGAYILTPNHSGYSGFDAMLLSHEVLQATGRTPKVLAHHLWFLTETTAIPAMRLGFIEATTKNADKFLKKGSPIILFPEGEFGNFKPTSQAYRLQEFKRGFVRLALKHQCPIVPTLVIGAEETHINLTQLKFTKYLRGLVLPLPLNIIPLPAKWKIIFLKPIELPYEPEAAEDRELVYDLCFDIQDQMQAAINEQLKKRSSIF